MTAADDPPKEASEDDSVWLVRQFGRYAHLLKPKSSHGGGAGAFLAGVGALYEGTHPTDDSEQARRLLHLSNQQYRERLRNMQRLSAAHGRRLLYGSRGQIRKRTRGCELGVESSNSSSSEEETADESGVVTTSAAQHTGHAGTWRQPENSVDPALSGEPGRVLKEEANPLLLAAYDFVTCTAGSANCTAAALPTSLMRFLSSAEQEHHGPPGGKCEVSLSTRPTARCTDATAFGAGSKEDKENAAQDAVFEGEAPVPGEAELHPIRQLQESVANLREQNQGTNEHLMREQLKLLAVRWKCLLLSGWNILVAGCGSKARLLREFARLALSDGFCCILNAYQREFKLQQALQATLLVVRNYLRTHSKYTAAVAASIANAQAAAGASASCDRLVKELKVLLKACSHPLYLVVLGLDSSTLSDARRHLAALACSDKVRVICSVDHLLHALLVDAAELRDFRFVFETAHTRRDYRYEVLSRWGSMCGFVPGWLWTASRVHAGGAGGSSVNFEVVLRGLTTNHKRLLRSIAELQLAQIERNESPIVSLADLGTETSGVSLSLSKVKLKELLVEVTSHGAAVHARKDGQDAVAIRANKIQLQELLQLLENFGV